MKKSAKRRVHRPLKLGRADNQYTVKKVIVYPVRSRDGTNITLPAPGRVWLLTYRLGTGKTIAFFTVQFGIYTFQIRVRGAFNY
jgi:hypothetical protein